MRSRSFFIRRPQERVDIFEKAPASSREKRNQEMTKDIVATMWSVTG